MRIKILYKREWTFTGQDGKEVHGFTYGGTKETGGGITFTSRRGDWEKGDEAEVMIGEKWDERQSRIKFYEVSTD